MLEPKSRAVVRMAFKIFYDSYQEGAWFRNLHPSLKDAQLQPFPSGLPPSHPLSPVLGYDRPDVVLTDGDAPILVLERTVEVPSGHNVGQRFARLVAAAQSGIPVVYFGPYKAYKHGGATRGPRYMNLRLFYALASMAKIEDTAVTTINWPVDTDCEIVKTSAKDLRPKEYLNLFFTFYGKHSLREVSKRIMASPFERQQDRERASFIDSEVREPAQYEGPPASVAIEAVSQCLPLANSKPTCLSGSEIIVLYAVGMRHIRSDPYTGMAMLYAYLYCGGMKNRSRKLILHFPRIQVRHWDTAAQNPARKDIRLFRLAADGILFSDAYRPRSELA